VFCSSDCQWKHYWTPERRADDKWVKDLEKFAETCKPKYRRTVSDLHKKLAMPRLVSIKKKIATEDWAGWAAIAKRINGIAKLAAK
jgi:enolase